MARPASTVTRISGLEWQYYGHSIRLKADGKWVMTIDRFAQTRILRPAPGYPMLPGGAAFRICRDTTVAKLYAEIEAIQHLKTCP